VVADMLVTSDELKSWMQLDTINATAATLVIAAATAKVQEVTKQRLVQVLADTETIEGTPEAKLRLPQRPASNVTSVLLDGQPLASSEWRLDGGMLFRSGGWQAMTIPWWIAAATPFRYGLSYAWGAWDRPISQVTFTYDHGWATGASELEPARAKVFQLASQAYLNPQGVQSLAIDDYKAVYLSKTMHLPDEEARALRRYYGRYVDSIRVSP
jgi:hypothetical protein